MSDAEYVAIAEQLLRRPDIEGREFESFTNEWLRHCEAVNQNPMARPDIVTVFAECDRNSGCRLGEAEKYVEMQAFITLQKRSRQQEGEQ